MSEETENEPTKIEELKRCAQAVTEASPFGLQKAAKEFSDQLIEVLECQEREISRLSEIAGRPTLVTD